MTSRDGRAHGPGPAPDGAEVAARIQAPPGVTLDQGFDASNLYALRSAVAAHATDLGLADHRLADLILTATELATNAIRHGGGSGQLRLWRAETVLYCQVSDAGPGLSDPDRAGIEQVPLRAAGGRGLWLVRQLCDRVDIATAVTGTTITVALDDTGSPAASPDTTT